MFCFVFSSFIELARTFIIMLNRSDKSRYPYLNHWSVAFDNKDQKVTQIWSSEGCWNPTEPKYKRSPALQEPEPLSPFLRVPGPSLWITLFSCSPQNSISLCLCACTWPRLATLTRMTIQLGSPQPIRTSLSLRERKILRKRIWLAILGLSVYLWSNQLK